MFDANFQMTGYLSVTSMVGAKNLIMWVPILIHAYVQAGAIVAKPEGVLSPTDKIVSNSLVKRAFEKAIRDSANLLIM